MMQYIWYVTCPGQEPVEVRAEDKLRAVTAAAGIWKRRWTEIAKDCEAVKIRKAVGQ